MSKGEIRGLIGGIYHNDDGTIICKISKNDFGAAIEFADFEANCFYTLQVSEDKKVKFDWGTLDQSMLDEMNKDDNFFDDTRKDDNG